MIENYEDLGLRLQNLDRALKVLMLGFGYHFFTYLTYFAFYHRIFKTKIVFSNFFCRSIGISLFVGSGLFTSGSFNTWCKRDSH